MAGDGGGELAEQFGRLPGDVDFDAGRTFAKPLAGKVHGTGVNRRCRALGLDPSGAPRRHPAYGDTSGGTSMDVTSLSLLK